MAANIVSTNCSQTAPAVAVLDARKPVEEDLSQLFEKVSIQESPKPRQRSVEQIQALYDSDRLLVRAMETEDHFQMMEYGRGPRLESYEDEADHMLSKKGLYNTSCTLLVKNEGADKQVGLYKPTGFLFNGGTAEIQHISATDSGSCCDNSGQLIAADDFLVASLDALAALTRETDLLTKHRYNEVNAVFRMDDLEGLFLSHTQHHESSPAHRKLRTTMRVIQKLFEKKYGVHLPIVTYDLETGKIVPLSDDRIRGDLSETLRDVGREHRQELETLLGIKR